MPHPTHYMHTHLCLQLYRASDRVQKNLRNYAVIQGDLCDKKGQLCDRLCDFPQLI